MKIGIHLANNSATASASAIATLAVRAEELGLDSVWVSDHVTIPVTIDTPYPYGPPGSFNPDATQNFWEAFSVLSFVAGLTKRIELGTSVIVLPQRQPLLVAKQWATLDALSGGRCILGVGAGWMREEFEALGMGEVFKRRGAATDEAIALMRQAWTTQGNVSFQGDVYGFPPVRMLPKPARPGGIPIWIGGHGKRSLRRAAELGDGWQPLRIPLDEVKAHLAYLHKLLPRYGRKPEDVTVAMGANIWAPGTAPPGSPNDWDVLGSADQCAERLKTYADAGISHMMLGGVRGAEPSAILDAIEFVAREVRPRLERM